MRRVLMFSVCAPTQMRILFNACVLRPEPAARGSLFVLLDVDGLICVFSGRWSWDAKGDMDA